MSQTLRVHALVDQLGAGGAELLLAELAHAAPAAGIELTVGYLADRGGSPAARRLREAGVEPELVGISRLGPAELRAVHRQVEAAAPDVLHCHLDAADILGGLSARRLGVPAVSTLHAMRWVGADPKARLRLRLAAAARRRWMQRIVAVSEAARDRYLERGWSRPGQLVVVHNGIRGEAQPGAGAAVRATLGIAPDAFVVGVLAALRPEKNHNLAIAAVSLLRGQVPGARLLIVGDGPARDSVRRAAGEAGDAVVMAGHRDDVMGVIDALDVLLHIPAFDALPTALMEAMAARVPVLAARVGGIPEIVQDGVTGILLEYPPAAAPAAAALAALAADPARRAAMADAGRRRFEAHFEAHAWADRLRALYDEVLR